jgi:hypothetical protein
MRQPFLRNKPICDECMISPVIEQIDSSLFSASGDLVHPSLLTWRLEIESLYVQA